MSNEILNIISSQGIWTLLSFILIYYIMNVQEKRDIKQNEREKKYQQLLSQSINKFELINKGIDEIKSKL